MSDLEERVTALEEALAHPPSFLDAPEMSEADAQRLREAFAECAARNEPLRVIPHTPLLTPALARELVRECVTIVQPGELLAIRVPDWWTPNGVYETNKWAAAWLTDNTPGVKVLFVPGEEFAIANPETDDEFIARIKRALPRIQADARKPVGSRIPRPGDAPGVVFTAADPQPPPGTRVRDDCGLTWRRGDPRLGEDYWVRGDSTGGDPESWSKIAGNYGPVTVLEWGDSA